jgi:hypothetical protein
MLFRGEFTLFLTSQTKLRTPQQVTAFAVPYSYKAFAFLILATHRQASFLAGRPKDKTMNCLILILGESAVAFSPEGLGARPGVI